ncbi:hormogonium polysaccharide secretion pseudopilin HpsC [Trichocoleus sp. DQ-A3]|uniref:hormogonium polysaccharide secretion pseudopilin HpsC n=1 Tax=Cyanophyceae TaxID=3028117 RepID=UPI0016883CA7|nr:hormogonium polysaccharide secretion pseudopilin HpsC [Coleofasciculus sp. FACHB-125]MBD1899043.1 prepilin-type N-terminal cleavage/methylation domain-containing protein [Coleofasciculus sp. FACHB-125]
MINSLKFLLINQLKRPKLAQKTGGFTLIELLVAMILSVLVIGPLLGFMTNILDTDRKEQAKANSEQEIKAALDYIAQDLEQAVYIYDDVGLSAISSQLPPAASGSNGCGTTNSCVPVLVFWRRTQRENVIPVNTAAANCPPAGGAADNCDDAFVYSLVAYYLIKDSNGVQTPWSPAARIGRFEIKDGVRNPNPPANSPPYLADTATTKKRPDDGFALFNLSISGTLQQKMNQWQKLQTNANGANSNYSNPTNVLIDYIDQTPSVTPGVPTRVDCGTVFQDTTTTPPTPLGKAVPSPASVNALGINNSSFYACVDSLNNRAQVFIRGNALARIQNTAPNYSPQSVYFPTATIQIKGRGFLFTK